MVHLVKHAPLPPLPALSSHEGRCVHMFLIHSNVTHLHTAKQCKAKTGLRAVSFINFVFTPEAVNYIFRRAKDLNPQNIYTGAKHRTSTLYRGYIV